MARLILLTVGVPSEPAIRELVSAYIRRMRPPFWVMEWQTVKEVSYQRGQETQAKIKEAQKLLSKIPENALMVLLDVKGAQWSTEALLVAVRNWRDSGRPVVFVVGGSLGVDSSVYQRADQRWSLSKLTFSHALAQLLVAEQIYRLATLDLGHPYHKA